MDTSPRDFLCHRRSAGDGEMLSHLYRDIFSTYHNALDAQNDSSLFQVIPIR